MPPVLFDPTILAGERPKTCTLDREATGTGKQQLIATYNIAIDKYE